MRIVFAGTPASAVPVLEALIASSHEIVGVLTRPPARQGRGRKLVDSPVAVAAQTAGIPVFTPKTLRDPAEHPDWSQLEADLAIVVAYGMLLPESVLNKFPLGWWNLHYSLLPDWRGAAPVQATILAGLSETGVSLFQIDPGLDTGPIFKQARLPLTAEHTADTLLADLSTLGAGLVRESVDELEQLQLAGIWQDSLRPQPEQSPTPYARMFKKNDAFIDWQQPAQVVSAQIRAYTTAPGAWCLLPDGQKMTVFPVDLNAAGAPEDLKPGEVLVEKKAVWFGCADQPVAASRLQPPGKKPMPAADWGRGQRYGERFQLQLELDHA